MKYTIDNKTIDIPDKVINDYKKYTGIELSVTNIRAMYQRAIDTNKSNIKEDIINQIKQETEIYKNPQFINDAFLRGINP